MLARSIEIGHSYFRSSRAGKNVNGSAQSVGRISRRRNPPTAVPELPSGGLRFANPPYALAVRRYAVRMRSRSRGREGNLYVRFTGTI
jgi:hypothetical protein